MARKSLTFSAETVTIYHLPSFKKCPAQKRIKPENRKSVKAEIGSDGLPILQEGTRLCDFCEPYVRRRITKSSQTVKIKPLGRSRKRR